jgi:RNA polymerase sigma-70 factor (ECF subfamily)
MTLSADVAWVRSTLAQHQTPLLRFAALLVGPALADDVVQDTFLRLLAARREDVEDHVVAWLFTVCKNRALEIKRGRSRETHLEKEEEMISHQPTPADALEQHDERSRIMRLVDALPERHREVVALRFAGGLSYREIAGVTGLTETNVGFILHAALKTLKKRLAVVDANDSGRRAS